MASISSPGIGSGLDINALVTQLVAAEAQPANLRLTRREAGFQTEISGLGSIKSALSSFQSALSGIKDISGFQKRTATSADTTKFTATASSAAQPGAFQVEVVKLAKAHQLASSGYIGTTSAVGNGTIDITSGQ